MQNTTIFKFGDVVLVYYYHTDSPQVDKRPAVVVSSEVHNRDDIDIVLMQVTTQERHEDRHGAIAIKEWESVGLLWPSVIKPVLFTYDKTQVLRLFGRLEPPTRKKLMVEVAKIFGFNLGRPSSA
jgi:PemK-like, MazF-like toxin of type II toxin-antitoxin system